MILRAHAKLHGLRVTRARYDYEGSITIDAALLRASGIAPYELVHVNASGGRHWETYVIPGEPGECQANGPAADVFGVGDELVVVCYRSTNAVDGGPPTVVRV